MKKTLVITVCLVFALSSMAWAVPKSNVGCGWGTMLFQGNDGVASQACAATTNGLFGNQTFGISSGTIGCDKPAQFWSEKANIFVAENMDNLAVDIAAGQGETLDTLADIMEVPAEKRPDFYASLQSKFDTIYPSADITHEYVVEQITVVVEQI